MNKVKAKYKAIVLEDEYGDIEILYECNRQDKSCNKKYCNEEECSHTTNINYAKNYINEKDNKDSYEGQKDSEKEEYTTITKYYAYEKLMKEVTERTIKYK